MKPIFCLFDIFIPFLVRTSMLSSRQGGEAAHKAVIKEDFRRKEFRGGLPGTAPKLFQRRPHSSGEDRYAVEIMDPRAETEDHEEYGGRPVFNAGPADPAIGKATGGSHLFFACRDHVRHHSTGENTR
ncbi:hypothetical protein H009_23557 [Agrobacterium tumefaciens str. Cherry 2E-2-2]|nr:hypothetical protein H009_23557 [Agrobacterium tumefaciens str. Cherry 2E-2-2]